MYCINRSIFIVTYHDVMTLLNWEQTPRVQFLVKLVILMFE